MGDRFGLVGIVAIVASGAAVAGVFACRQAVGIDQYFNAPADAGAGMSSCGLPYGTTACASCAATHCCDQATACAASSACNAYETCLGTCSPGDPACRAQCGIYHATGTTSEVSALSACLVTHCENDCGLSCGALAGWAVEPDAAVGFRTCMATQCDAVRACASSAACDAVTRCFAGCFTDDCVDTCMAAHGVNPAWFYSIPDAGLIDATSPTSTFVAFDQARAACATSAGSYWECVGHVSWPPVQATTITLQTAVVDVLSGLGLPGAVVEACTVLDPDCTTTPGPWVVRQTDARGQASLPFQLRASGTGGYLKVTSGTTVSEYFYWGFPLSQSQYVAGVGGSASSARGVAIDTVADYQSLKQQIAAMLDGGLEAVGDTPVGVFVEDCMHQPAPGVQITFSPADTQTIALNGNLTPGDPITDGTGNRLFIHVPEGAVTVTATPTVLGKPSGTVSARVRAGTTTTIVVGPTP